jgi:prevent-host-death family protein
MHLPHLVSVTQLRRQTSEVLRWAVESGRPVFVTQYGSVELVLLTRRAYDRLLRAAEREQMPGATPAHAEVEGREQEQDPTTKASGVETVARAEVPGDPLAVFGRLPSGTLFETKWGLVDADTAAFFMEDGEEVRPFLSPERLQAALDAVR